MTAIAVTPEERLAIVSDLARGRSTIDVAARHHVSAAVVTSITHEYGPGMGELAKAAERLRNELNAGAGFGASTNVTLSMLDKAAALPRLAKQAAKVFAVLTEISESLAAAESIARLEAIAAKRRKDLVDAEQALRDAKGIKPKTKTVGTSESAQIRAWAVGNGYTVGPVGIIPNAVRDAWKAAQK